MIRFSIVATLIFTLGFLPGFAQTNAEMEENFDEGQYFFNRGDYEDAALFYLRLMDKDSLNANFNFKIGECYLNIPGKEHLAIPYFERSLTKIVAKQDYRKRSFSEDAAPLHAYFYLGNAYRMNNQLDKALDSYMKFIDSPYFHNNYNLNVVDREIKSCERAKIIQDAPLDYTATNLGESVNTSFAEERPVVSGDGNTLVFIRRLQFYDAIFFTTKKEGKWQLAVNINPQLISDGDFYPTGLSSDGTQLLLVKKVEDTYDIYTSAYDGTVWSKAEKMDKPVSSSASDIHASFGPGDNSIFLSSNRKGTKGGFDLWFIERKEDGWAKAKNLGKDINTELDEKTAFFCDNNEVLFFSSQAHYTMGGFDIFYSGRIGKKWRVPVNIGYPINDTRDNLNYCPSQENCKEGYYAITNENGNGASDIYLISIKSESTLYSSE